MCVSLKMPFSARSCSPKAASSPAPTSSLPISMTPEQTLRVSPTLIMVNSLLAASSLELQQMVQTELDQNPALESVDTVVCTRCGAGVTGRFCPVCAQPIYPSQLADGATTED